jgi:hypothetical protein
MLAIRYTVKYALFATLTIASIWIGNRLMSSHDEQLMIGPPQSPLSSVRWFDPSRAPDQVVTVTPPEQKAAPATPALRDMDPDDARDAAAVEDAKRNLCLPPPSERVRVWFQSIANNAGVCFSIYATYGACFEIRGSTLVLTNAFPVQGTQVDACAIGFCRPDRVPNKFFDYRDIIATTLDGKQVVVADHAQVSFFEADTKKHLHSLSYSMYPREIDILIHVVSDSAPTNAAAVRIAAFYSDSCSPITGCPAPPETKNPSEDNGNRGKESNQAADDAIR